MNIKTKLNNSKCSKALKLLCLPNPFDRDLPIDWEFWNNQTVRAKYIGSFNREDFCLLDLKWELVQVVGRYNKIQESEDEMTLIELEFSWNRSFQFYFNYLLIPFAWIFYKTEYSSFLVLNYFDLIAFLFQFAIIVCMYIYIKFKTKFMFLEIENRLLKAENFFNSNKTYT